MTPADVMRYAANGELAAAIVAAPVPADRMLALVADAFSVQREANLARALAPNQKA